MFTSDYIQSIVDRIVEQFHPEKVILFGSYAYGEPTEDSDIDLMLVMDYEGRDIHQAMQIYRALNYPGMLDLKIRTPAEMVERNKPEYVLTWTVINKGRTLYERPVKRMAS
jgi:uncharacterized protein